MSKHVVINDMYYKRLDKTRELYMKKYHRKITLGTISELLYERDPVIQELYKEASYLVSI